MAKDNDIGMFYALEIVVTDGRFSDRCIVKIDVKKSDNSGLVFAKDQYHTSVLENSTKSDIILVVNVLGSALNENLQVNYFAKRFLITKCVSNVYLKIILVHNP